MAIYRDLNCFTPTTRPMLLDVECIYQALFNIFNTRPGEVPFSPEFGVDLEDELFEIIDDVTAFAVYGKVIRAVQRWERRASLDTALSTVVPFPDDNKYEITLYFRVNGLSNQVFEYRGSFLR